MTTRPRATRTFPLLPDPPEREPEDMTSFTHLTKTGSVRDLVLHLGNPATTIVEGERRLWPTPDSPVSGRMVPDLLIAFGTDPDRVQAKQRIHHLPAGQTARLHTGTAVITRESVSTDPSTALVVMVYLMGHAPTSCGHRVRAPSDGLGGTKAAVIPSHHHPEAHSVIGAATYWWRRRHRPTARAAKTSLIPWGYGPEKGRNRPLSSGKWGVNFRTRFRHNFVSTPLNNPPPWGGSGDLPEIQYTPQTGPPS